GGRVTLTAKPGRIATQPRRVDHGGVGTRSLALVEITAKGIHIILIRSQRVRRSLPLYPQVVQERDDRRMHQPPPGNTESNHGTSLDFPLFSFRQFTPTKSCNNRPADRS